MSVLQPPRAGTLAGAQAEGTPNGAKGSPRFPGGTASARMACAMGCNPPPKAPCKTRKKSSNPRLGANPQRNELRVKNTIHVKKKRLRPSQLTRKPLLGSTTALDTR